MHRADIIILNVCSGPQVKNLCPTVVPAACCSLEGTASPFPPMPKRESCVRVEIVLLGGVINLEDAEASANCQRSPYEMYTCTDALSEFALCFSEGPMNPGRIHAHIPELLAS